LNNPVCISQILTEPPFELENQAGFPVQVWLWMVFHFFWLISLVFGCNWDFTRFGLDSKTNNMFARTLFEMKPQFPFSDWDFSFGEVTIHRQNAFSLNWSKVSHLISLAPLIIESEKVLETQKEWYTSADLTYFFLLGPNVTLTHTHKSSDVWLVFNVKNLEWNFFIKS